MIPSDFRLDSVAVHLVERLEGVRRSYLGDPDGAQNAFTRIAKELVGDAAGEASEYVDDPRYPRLLEREILETFLPRYTRLALEHNTVERSGYGAWRGGDPLARIGATVIALVVVTFVTRLVPSPLVAPLWGVALAMPVMPEIRAAWYRLRYRRQLQAAVDDLARIQGQVGVYEPSDDRPLLSDRAASSSRTGGEKDRVVRDTLQEQGTAPGDEP